MASAFLALIDPGDEVVVFEPFYENYGPDAVLAGATPVFVPLRAPDWRIDEERLTAAMARRPKAIVLNTPHNPSGKVFSRAELQLVADVCREHDLVAVTDEVYEHLVYDGEHVPLATLPGMAERTVTISSLGKTFSVTGWKTGWVTAPAPFIRAIQTVKQFLTFTVSAPYQRAVAYGLREELGWVATMRASLQAKRDRLMAGLEAAGFGVYRPAGTYFVQTDIRPLGLKDGLELTRALPERVGVVAIPTQVFYDDDAAGRPFVRFAFCKRDQVIDDAVERLAGLTP
jgi:N-succinyldiaminopimelate aminotransferase